MNATLPSRRGTARRPAHSVEPLESRFLLSGLDPSPTTTTTTGTLLPLPADVASQVSGGPAAPQWPIGLFSGPLNARIDLYTLQAVDGNPTIQVELIWPEGGDPTDGQMNILDASGNPLYDLPLAGVHAIDAHFPIDPGGASPSSLEINLHIDPAGSGQDTPGTYQITISWDPPASTAVASQPAALAGAVASPPLGSVALTSIGPVSGSTVNSNAPGIIVAPVDSITATRDLPPGFGTSTPPPPAPAVPQAAPAPPLMAEDAPGSARAVAVPADPTPATTPSTGPSSTAPSSTTGGYQVPLPLAMGGSGLSSLAIAGSGNRRAVAGPLPLAGTGPDGGIFAYPDGRARGEKDPFRPTFTITPGPAPVSPDELDDLTGLAIDPRTGRPRQPGGVDLLGFPSISRPFDFDMAGAPLASGAAFLPPINPLVARDPDRPGNSRWPVSYGSTRRRSSPGAILLTSVGLFFGLIAPDGLVLLTAWQDDRRWKRNLSLGDPKTGGILPD